MQPDLVREIAESIVRDQLLLNWRFFFLVIALGGLAGMAGYWTAPYLRKRAETFATKADMDEVLRQVALTTRTTEEVRSAVAQADWTNREWQTTRRLKLEELLSVTYTLDQWLDLQQSKWLHAKKIDVDGRPMDRVKLLATLYFPDLKPEADAVWSAHQKAYMFILKASDEPRNARMANDPAAYAVGLAKFKDGWASNYAATRVAVAALETKASATMAAFAGA